MEEVLLYAGTAGYCVGEINTVNIVKNNYDDYPSNVKNPQRF